MAGSHEEDVQLNGSVLSMRIRFAVRVMDQIDNLFTQIRRDIGCSSPNVFDIMQPLPDTYMFHVTRIALETTAGMCASLNQTLTLD